MKIVQPYARILEPTLPGEALLRRVEWIGRISHRSEVAQTDDSWSRFLESVVLKRGDWSITEHVVVSVDAIVDRGISHEWVRHRIAAYTQESTRFVNYAKKHTAVTEYVNPVTFICPPTIAAWEHHPHSTDPARNPYVIWLEGRQRDEQEYIALTEEKIRPEEARSCLPNALATRLVSTYNLRNWRWFFLARTTREAHVQMREVTIPLLVQFQQRIPLLFDDIEPGATQAENFRKAR